MISITMPVYNGEKTIGRAISSVIEQVFTNWELIIIDGYSSDKTLDIIRTYSDDRIRFYQVDRRGIYNAINEGLKECRGEWVINLNSDDFFGDRYHLQKYAEHSDKTADVLYCNLRIHSGDDIQFVRSRSKLKLFNSVFLGWFPPHPSFMVKRDIFQLIHFDENYYISGDYDWFIRAYMENLNFIYLQEATVDFSVGGISTNFRYGLHSLTEDIKVIKRNLGLLYLYIPILKRLRKIPRKFWEITRA